MARDYYKLEPDKFYPLNKHFTVGRAGAKVQFITRHHLMYIGEVEDVVDRIWNTRPASAHVVIGPKGRWGQAVGDNSTAWANANQWANQRTIAIEHSNNTGRFGGNDYHDKSWNISDETLIEGARVAAAYCLHYGLGEPKYGTNIRDHNHFTSTGCPVHLQGPRAGNAWGGKAGKYHQFWMDEAISFYHKLKNKEVHPDGTPIATTIAPPKKEHTAVNNEHDLHRLAKSIENQLLGPTQDERAENDRNPNGGRGWPQLGHNQDGQWLTVVDSIAALRQDVANLAEIVKENRNG